MYLMLIKSQIFNKIFQFLLKIKKLYYLYYYYYIQNYNQKNILYNLFF